jgi:hypothetical protein
MSHESLPEMLYLTANGLIDCIAPSARGLLVLAPLTSGFVSFHLAEGPKAPETNVKRT